MLYTEGREEGPVSIQLIKADRSCAGKISDLVKELAESIHETTPISEVYAAVYLTHPGTGVFLAEESGAPLGMVSYSFRPSLYHGNDGCVIEELIVREGYRNRGIGAALLSRVLEEAERHGCSEASVTTGKENARAIALYKKHGLSEEFLYLEKHFD
jgi:ribosomal protein S18 acetylase RimI-like enzyme